MRSYKAGSYLSHSKASLGAGGKYHKRVYYDEKVKDKVTLAHQGPTDYAVSLLDPWGHVQPRIPDLQCYPTSVVREESHFTWTVSTAATNANNQILIIDFAEIPAYFYCQGPGGATAGKYKGDSLAASGVTGIGSSASGYLQFDKWRVVSAGARVRFADNDTATKGLIWCATYPTTNSVLQENLGGQSAAYEDVMAGRALDLTSANAWAAQKAVYTGPIVNGAVGRYQPTGSEAFFMLKPATAIDTAVQHNWGRLAFFADSVATGTLLVVDIVVNLEAIPLANNQAFTVATSPVSGASLEAGLSIASAIPATFGGDEAELESNIQAPVRYLRSFKG